MAFKPAPLLQMIAVVAFLLGGIGYYNRNDAWSFVLIAVGVVLITTSGIVARVGTITRVSRHLYGRAAPRARRAVRR
jgi:hypothetical protein